MNPHLWPDGKHRHWDTIPARMRYRLLMMIIAGRSTDDLLRAYPLITVGTIAAVKANLNR